MDNQAKIVCQCQTFILAANNWPIIVLRLKSAGLNPTELFHIKEDYTSNGGSNLVLYLSQIRMLNVDFFFFFFLI